MSWLIFACFVGVILGVAASILFWGSNASLASMFVPVVAFAIVVTVANRIASRQSRHEIEAADYCLCLECRYPLGSLAAVGDCPECGTHYEHDQVRKCWRWTLDEAWRES